MHRRRVFSTILVGISLTSTFAMADDLRPLAHQNAPTIISAQICSPGRGVRELHQKGSPSLKLATTLSLKDFGTGFAWSPDGKLLATSESFDSVIKLWSVSDGKILHTLSKKSKRSNGIQLFTADGKYLITSTSDLSQGRAALSLIDVQSGELVRQIDGPAEASQAPGYRQPTHLALNETGSRLYAGFFSRNPPSSIYVYDTASWKLVDQIATPRNTTRRFVTGPQTGEITTTDVDGNVAVWDVASKKIQVQFPATSSTIWEMSLDRRTCRLVAGQGMTGITRNQETGVMERNGDPDTIRVWDLKTGTKLASTSALPVINDVAFSPNGDFVAAFDGDTAILYNSTDMSLISKIYEFSRGGAGSLAFSDSGEMLAVAGDKKVLIYSVEQR